MFCNETLDKGERSQDVDGFADDIWETTEGDRAGGSDGADQGSRELSDIACSRGPGDVLATNIIGGARVPKGLG